jgi:predicted membrane chloride channel (bestrophin family)
MIDQVAVLLGVTGADTQERLVNTRQVIRGLAQFAVSARKALKGQGQVSDFEGKLLVRAEAGNIDDFTLPELQAFLAVTDRLARRQYEQHVSNVKKLRSRKDLSDLADFYDVPPLPAAGRGGAGAPALPTPDAIDAELERRKKK